MAITKAYKIVEANSGELFSLVVSGVALVKYIPDEWAYPPRELADVGNRLCVFSTLKDALKFISVSSVKYGVDQIWECDVEGLSESTGTFLNPDHFSDEHDDIFTIEYILREISLRKRCVFLWACNTKMADAVKLVRRITWEEIVEKEPWVAI